LCYHHFLDLMTTPTLNHCLKPRQNSNRANTHGVLLTYCKIQVNAKMWSIFFAFLLAEPQALFPIIVVLSVSWLCIFR
jgi:hypothetical protein